MNDRDAKLTVIYLKISEFSYNNTRGKLYEQFMIL